MYGVYKSTSISEPLCSVMCPVCTSSVVQDRGALPQFCPYVFGGNKVGLLLEAGHLLHCFNCDLYFRHPYVTQSTLTALYEGLPPTVWQSHEARSYWPLVLELMQRYSPNRVVMDVGCFAGDFLNWLPSGWHKFGVEPGVAAREFALARGISLVGHTVENIHALPEPTGVITLFDVLEHVIDPLAVLDNLRKLLPPRGSLIILTGAADSLPWRIFGHNYWYCSLPEHVSFFTLKWFRWAAEHLGLSVEWFRYLSSEPGTFKQSLLNSLRLSAYALIRYLRQSGIPEARLARIPLLRKPAMWSSPPWWREAKDHILIVLSLRKTGL